MRAAIAVRGSPRTRDLAFLAGATLFCLEVGRLLPGRLESLSHTSLLAVPVALIFVLAVSWLVGSRPLAALALGVSLLGIVRVEPAPVDLVFGLLIVSTIVSKHARPRVPAFVAFPLAAFGVLSILSMTNAVDLHRAVKFESITIYMIALALWLSWAFTQEIWVRTAMRTYIVVAAICGALGPIALYLPLPGKDLFLYTGARAEGLFKDPNVYSAFLVPAAIILLEEVTTPRLLRWRRSIVIAAFGLVSMGVVVAYSRAAWLNYALAVMVLVFVQSTRRGGLRAAFKSIGLLLASGCVAFGVLFATGSLTFLQQRSKLEAYDTQRFANQNSAFGEMTRHLFGFGPGQTEVRLPISTHSSFARAAFEQGLLGISMLVLILAGTLLCALFLVRRQLDVHGVGTAALLGVWLGQIANGFFIDTIHWRHVWIMAALIWSGYMMATARERVRPPVLP
jgi:hypothetical protein